jgi:hypothetical protein
MIRTANPYDNALAEILCIGHSRLRIEGEHHTLIRAAAMALLDHGVFAILSG